MLRVMRRDTNPTHIPVVRGLATVMLVGVALLVPGGRTGAAGAADQSSHKLEAGYEQQPARRLGLLETTYRADGSVSTALSARSTRRSNRRTSITSGGTSRR